MPKQATLRLLDETWEQFRNVFGPQCFKRQQEPERSDLKEFRTCKRQIYSWIGGQA